MDGYVFLRKESRMQSKWHDPVGKKQEETILLTVPESHINWLQDGATVRAALVIPQYLAFILASSSKLFEY